MGSIPGYGLRRLLICADGKRKIPLKAGQRKSLAIDHVVLIPGPERFVNQVLYPKILLESPLDSTRIFRRVLKAVEFDRRGGF